MKVNRIFCIGRNYAEHIKELGNTPDDACVVFMKPASCVVPVGQPVTLPRGRGSVHHETELVVRLGAGGKVDALTLGLDLTLRDLQNELKKKGAPWLLVENVAYVPRPAWIVEGESKDPYYNFGKVIMYFDQDMYRIYWKLVHNRAGEYFYNAMCGYTFAVSPDRTFSAVVPTVVVGVNDKENRAAIGGRSHDQFIEQAFDPDGFSLQALRRRGE